MGGILKDSLIPRRNYSSYRDNYKEYLAVSMADFSNFKKGVFGRY